MGWLLLVLQLIINNKREIIRFCLTKANVDDRKPLKLLCKNLQGIIAEDKGYIDKKD